jgi:hypothetical protein
MRRWTVLLFILAMASCGPINSPSCDAFDAESEVDSHAAPEEGLYTDSEVEKLIAQHSDDAFRDHGLLVVYLDVVPDGESRPRAWVFKKLGIQESRLRNRCVRVCNLSASLEWQISPSFDLSCITVATAEPENAGVGLWDAERRIHGIVILERQKQDEQ